MDPITASGMITGGASLLGGLMTNRSSAKQAAKAMEFEAGQAQINRTWQNLQTSTAHQREVNDLRAAGLNPILSGTGGMGAAAGGGSSAKGIAAPVMDALGGAVHSAMAGRRNKAETDNIISDTRLKHSQGSLANLDANVRTSDYQLRGEQLATQRELTKEAAANASIATSSAKGAKVEGEIDETKYGAFMRYIDRAVKSATGGASALRGVRGR